MAPISYGHGLELLYKSILGLATSNGDIKTRLIGAFTELSGLRKEELPPALWGKFSSLYNEVTATPAIGGEGRIVATIGKMSDRRATELAEQVFDIFVELIKK